MPVDSGHNRLDRRQVDMVVGMELGLVGRAQRGIAMRACRRKPLHHAIGVLAQLPERARMALALLGRAPRAPIGLRSLARRYRGIVRRLGGLPQFRLQRLDPLRQRLDLRSLPRNHFRLRQNQSNQVVLGKTGKRIAIHRIVESRSPSRVNHIYGPSPASATK
jgi:hypothetical protein